MSAQGLFGHSVLFVMASCFPLQPGVARDAVTKCAWVKVAISEIRLDQRRTRKRAAPRIVMVCALTVVVSYANGFARRGKAAKQGAKRLRILHCT